MRQVRHGEGIVTLEDASAEANKYGTVVVALTGEGSLGCYLLQHEHVIKAASHPLNALNHTA